MLSSKRSRLKRASDRVKERRQKKVDGVESIFKALLNINSSLGDVSGTLNATKETQEGLEAAEVALRDLSEKTLPVVNLAGKALTGALAVGSFFMLREILKESKNV